MKDNIVFDNDSDQGSEWKTYAVWAIRILIAATFLVSAYAKVYPNPSSYYSITMFERNQLWPLGFSPMMASIFSRTLIGIEFALGIMMLLPFDLKKLVIPATTLLLAVFCIQLSYEIMTTGNSGNCGCFGALIPMTPLQALIKNIVAIGLLTSLLTYFKKQVPEKSNWYALGGIKLVFIAALFIFVPMETSSKVVKGNSESNDTPKIVMPKDTSSNTTATTETGKNPKQEVDTTSKKPLVPVGPKQKKSGFAKFFPKIDEGKKILCFFAPTCEHCMATGKQLTELKKSMPDFPEMQIIFMDEAPEEIPNYFKFVGSEYPYMVMDIIKFWETLGQNRDVPGVMYIWNGNIIKFYNGTKEGGSKDAFDKNEFKKILKK